MADRPLNFLDHHIKRGNSLIGATPELLEDGVPYDAFALGRPGDDRELAKAFRKQNRQERRDYEQSGGYQMTLPAHVLTDERAAYRTLNAITELGPSDPKLARERYMEYLTSDTHRLRKLEADFWTAAFFWPMPEGPDWAPTFGEFTRLRHEGPEALPAQRLAQISVLADEHKFFHWHLEFEEVFEPSPNTPASSAGTPSSLSRRREREEGAGGRRERAPSRSGFDVVLGNPPWEMINLMEKEFFADKALEIANASTAAKRRKLIRKLPEAAPALHREYQAALYYSECLSDFLRQSGRYPLSAACDINTYQVFSGLARQIVGLQRKSGDDRPKWYRYRLLQSRFLRRIDNRR